jgi:hypothetical protein
MVTLLCGISLLFVVAVSAEEQCGPGSVASLSSLSLEIQTFASVMETIARCVSLFSVGTATGG